MILTKVCQNKCSIWFLIALCFSLKLSGHEIDQSFKKLTCEEKSSLSRFFDTAIKIDQLGHVLFFTTKPACFFIIDKEPNLFTNAWNVWKSKEFLFPHPNFIVYEENFENKTYVYFINKQTLFSQLSSKKEILKKIYGDSFSVNGLIDQLEQRAFPSLICKNHILLGILLGYGIESSLGYIGHIDPNQSTSSKELTGILCAADGKIETTQLEDGVTLCSFKSKVAIHPVSFIGDPDSNEVKNLKEIYSSELDKIEEIYQSKDLLTLCLEKLCTR